MAHGVGDVVNEHGVNTMKMVVNGNNQQANNQHAVQQSASSQRKNVGVMGSRRIFAAAFKLKVLDSYRNDIDCRGNQRATARKYGIHRRQIQKWLQCEDNLRSSCAESNATTTVTSTGCCEIPIGRNGNGSASPATIVNNQMDVTSKNDAITTLSTSASSPSLSSSSTSTNNDNTVGKGDVGGSLVSPPCSGTPIPAPALVGTTTAPALNLSLARLHGDDENHRQAAAAAAAPPAPNHPSIPSVAPMRHTILRECSPLENLQHNNSHNHQVPSSPSLISQRVAQMTYDNKSQRETAQHQSQCHQRHEGRQQASDEHRMTERHARDIAYSPEIKYSYVMTRANYERNDGGFVDGSHPRCANPDGYYQALDNYRKNVGFRNNHNNNNNLNDIELLNGSYTSYRDRNINEAGNVVLLQHSQTTSFASSSIVSCVSPTAVLHATAIKSERASPDSLASSPHRGPCEAPGSPESAATMPSQHPHNQQHYHRPSNQQTAAGRMTAGSRDARTNRAGDTTFDVCANTRNEENVVAAANTASGTAAIAVASVAVHSNETASTLAHVHVGVAHAHARLSEKRQREREHRYGDSIKVEYEEGIRGTSVKEEIAEGLDIEESNVGPVYLTMITPRIISSETRRDITEEEALHEDSRYHREFARTSDARTPTGSSSLDSSDGPSSPITRGSNGGSYSGLSSPRAASSSGISTSSSCSDSEIDPLDYSSTSARNTISDLSRRRSFSLRFKLDVLNAFHSDIAVAGNQRATARKFGINRRQVQKWLGQECELRGEIALRGGDLRQRLGPMSEINGESTLAVDLRTSSTSTVSSLSGMRSDNDLENSSSSHYCCDNIGSSPRVFRYYGNGNSYESPELTSQNCTLSCCIDNVNGNTTMMCYQDTTTSQRRHSSGYPESRSSLYCYSPRDSPENDNEAVDVTTENLPSPSKRSACTLNCCYDLVPSPKRACIENIDETAKCQEQPPQEVPLCLVKPKGSFDSGRSRTEPVTSTVPTPPAQQVPQPAPVTSGNKRDAILFKPYLDNPVRKPTEEEQHPNPRGKHGGLSPNSLQSVIVNNNNNNCHGICNLNEERTIVTQRNDYALELSLRVPVNWAMHHGAYGEFPERLRSAFVRYPTSPHYT